MNGLTEVRKFPIILLLLIGLVGSWVLAACNGSAFVDFTYDPTAGVGNVVITGDQDQPATQQPQQDKTSQILLFGLVIAILLGTVAIVMSVSRRPR
jgi:hypothetical protein